MDASVLRNDSVTNAAPLRLATTKVRSAYRRSLHSSSWPPASRAWISVPLPRLGITPSSGALKSRRAAPGTLMLRSMRSLRKISPAGQRQAKHRTERNIQDRLRLVRSSRRRRGLHDTRIGIIGTELLRLA